jgi:RimJ/RimL family protein N-acetyltransferase
MQYKLRPWTINDLDSLVTFANNANIARFMMNKFPHPYSRANGETFIQFAMQGNPPNIMAIEVDGKAAGGIGLHQLSDVECKNAELGYWLAEDHWGKGIITQAVTQMVDYGFKNFDINRIFARPYGNNIASQKVLQKAGFLLETVLKETFFKNGQYLDEHIYATRRPH